MSMSILFGMAGAAKWCLNQRTDAVKEWHRALSCTYTDGARIRIPLLLYFASVVAPDVYSDAEAQELLLKRVESAWARNWPGAVGEFVLGRIDEQSLQAKCSGVNNRDTLSRHWYIQFYIGVREYAKGHISRFEELMRLTSSVSDDDFNPDHASFRWKLGYEEFFLARHYSKSSMGDIRVGPR
jgi:lipoprotein NlpI